MSSYVEGGKFADRYTALVEACIQGRMVSPRGQVTFEHPGPVVIKAAPFKTVHRRKMNTKLGVLEALMMVAGQFDLSIIEAVAPKARLDLYQKQSDYGPRIGNQVSKVIGQLRTDHSTRQACLYFNHKRHWQTDDLACTQTMHFMIRNDSLETYVNVRSWDLAFGFPMDMMMYGFMSQVIARCLNVSQGPVYVAADSVHVYASTMELATATEDLEFTLGPGWPQPGGYWVDYKDRAAHAVQEFAEVRTISPAVVGVRTY